ncbi:MAG: BrnA antitoxin family protein [Pseudomonadota bacterium]
MAKSERITRVTLQEARSLEGKTDWAKLDSPAGLGDANDPDDFTEEDWANAVIVHPQPKVAVSIRLDNDVLEFFKKDGKGYQTRMNAVLRTYMEAKRR